MSKSNPQGKNLEKFISTMCKGFLLALLICWCGAKRINYKNFEFWGYLIFGIEFIAYVTFVNHQYLVWLNKAIPHIFTYKMINRLSEFSEFYHFLFLSCILIFMVLFIKGLGTFSLKRKYQLGIKAVGLKNANGQYPTVEKIIQKDDFKTKVIVKSHGIGIDRYTAKWSDFESAFRGQIESFKTSNDKSFVEIMLNKKRLPKICRYEDMEKVNVKPYSFIIGESIGGAITQTILTLPHLLIAGTTGGGKSVFFKQLLLGLLKSSRHLQIYLLDLKKGVEVKEFGILPNIHIAKNETESVILLNSIKEEMNKRFDYLEHNGHKSINPKRDKMDLIVVGIDEASVLYGKGAVDKAQKDLIMKARQVTDELAKLGRAAGIHLILATQKVIKESIDTKVQENIGGRMCFKMNTGPGSMNVLGNNKAHKLPDIKGRGIWANGNNFIEVQAPFISEEEVKEEVEMLAAKIENDKNWNFQKMLEMTTMEMNKEDEKYQSFVSNSKSHKKKINS